MFNKLMTVLNVTVSLACPVCHSKTLANLDLSADLPEGEELLVNCRECRRSYALVRYDGEIETYEILENDDVGKKFQNLYF